MADVLEVDHHLYPIGSTPLHLAANNNDTKTLAQLLHSYNNLADRINLIDGNGRTPLVVALKNGRMEAAVLLIEAGADVKVPYLRDNKTVIDVLSTESCFLPIVSRLTELCVLDCLTPAAVSPWLHSLAYECTERELNKIETILTNFPRLVDAKDNLGCTPLHYAVISGELNTVLIILKFAPDLKATNPYGNTALHLACEKGHLIIVETILSQVDEPHSLLRIQNQLERTPLHTAMYSKQLVTVQYIIEECKSFIDTSLRDTDGHTISTLLFTLRFSVGLDLEETVSIPCLTVEEATWLLHECVWCGNMAGIASSITQGAIVNSFDFMQQTPLLVASQLGNVKVCRALIEGGANPNVYDESSKTPLHYACKREREDVFKYLLSLNNIDLKLFYQTYDDPLTLGQIESLLFYYRHSMFLQLPDCWLDWLVLAASNQVVAADTFTAFAQEICPTSGSHLVANIREYKVAMPTDSKKIHICIDEALQTEISTYPMLSYLKALPVALRRCSSVRGYPLEPMREIMKKQKPTTHPSRLPPFIFRKFKQISTRKRPRNILYFGPRSTLNQFHGNNLISFFHCLLVHKNFKVFELTFTEALHRFPDCVDFMFPQGKDHQQSDAHLLLDMIGKYFEELESCLESLSVVKEIKTRLMEKTPEKFCMEQALLLYLMSGSINYYYANRVKVVQRHPFPSWPLWFIELQCRWYFQSLGWEGRVNFSTNEDREELSAFLLERSDLGAESTLDPAFLLEAVQKNCVWGVQLLLKHGASPLAPSKIRYPLVQAVKRCQTPIINALLDAWSHESHMTEDFLSALIASLPVLATRVEAATIEKILTTLSLRENKQLWLLSFSHVSRLIYLLLLSPSNECVELGKSLAEDTMCFLCHYVLHCKSLQEISLYKDFNSNVHRYLSSLNVILQVAQNVHKQFFKDCVTFITICIDLCIDNRYSIDDVFAIACKRGMYPTLEFVLNHTTSSDVEFLRLNSTGEINALYNAACSGDYNTIKLLVDLGFNLTPSKEPPLYGYIDSLVQLKLTCPHQVSVCRSTHCQVHSNTALKRQKAMVDVFLPSKEYLFEALQSSPKFPFSKISELLNLKITKRILIDIFAIYKCDVSLASQVCWVNVVRSFAVQTIRLSVRDLVPLLDELLASVLPETIVYDIYTCRFAAKAGLWSYCIQAIKNCTIHPPDISLIHVITRGGKVDILRLLYAKSGLGGWMHTKTLELIEIAVWNKQTDCILFLLSQLDTTHEKALAAIVKSGDEPCFDAAIRLVMSSHPGAVEDNLLMLLTAATMYNRSALITKIIQEYNKLGSFEISSDDKQFNVNVTILEAAVRYGLTDVALHAFESLPHNLIEKLKTDDSFHTILCWSCYWGMVELLRRLPFTSAQLLHRDGEQGLSPWECALAHGHVGKISYLDNAPTLAEAWKESLDEANPAGFKVEHLLIGSFDGLIAVNKTVDNGESTNFERFECPFSRQIQRTIILPTMYLRSTYGLNPQTCIALVKCLGRYAGEFLCRRMVSVLDPVKVISDEAFKIILDAMAETDHLQEYFDKVGAENCECFIKLVLQGSVVRVKALLHHGMDILKYDSDCHSRISGSILHAAVRTRNAEMVTLILNLYGDTSHEACLQENSEKESSLYLAFALGAGEVLQKTSLLKTVAQEISESRWRMEGINACGWFHLMMTRNERSKNSTGARCNFLFNIREVQIEKLLITAMKYRNINVVKSVVAATGNVVQRSSYDVAYLSVEGGSDFYGEVECPIGNLKIDLLDFTTDLTKKCSNDEQMLFFMKYHDFTTIQEVLKMFHTSCCLNRYEVVCQLLEQRAVNETVRSALSVKGALEEGLLLAIASGNYNTAVHLSLETGLTYESIDVKIHPVAKCVPELSKLIFSYVSYYNLLEKFYKSLCECGEKLSLAASWLAHNWTPSESLLIVKQLGNTSYAPSNPWLLQLSAKDGTQSREVLLTVDWDSFSECFLSTPLPHFQDKHRYTPVLVEAVVFSPAVLGQICGHTGSNRGYEQLSLLSDLEQISSLIVTAQVWPAVPSFKLYGDQGTLTLSYKPSDGAISFPSLDEIDPFHDQSSFDSSAVSSGSSEDVTDLFKFFKRKLKKVVAKGLIVTVSCDCDFTIADHSSAITQALNDCVNVLSLVQSPHVLYASLHPGMQFKKLQCFSGTSPFLNRLEVHLVSSDRYNFGHLSCVSVVRQDRTLKISITISCQTVMDKYEEDDRVNTNSFYELLFEGLVECLLDAEREACVCLVEEIVSNKILPNLSRSLKMGRLDEGFVSLGVQDSKDTVRTLQDLSKISLPQIKNFIKMTKFVNSFSKLIQVLTLKPRLARALFNGGLKVILTEIETTSFTTKGGYSILKLSATDLQTRARSDNMVAVFQSVISAASRTKPEQKIVEFPPPNIPAPFRCHIDIARSPGFQFPSEGRCNTIRVQLVDYNGRPLTSSPTNQCILNVTIKDCNSKQISASSSTDPHFKTASKDLLVNLKPEGIFELQWTPRNQGIHDISIRLNNTPIEGSPFKAYSCSYPMLGYRQTIAGQPLVFVASHSSHSCQRNVYPSVEIPSKPSIVPMCLKAVQPLVEASKRNMEVEAATGCVKKRRRQHTKTDHQTSNDESQMHYISMALKHGGLSQWLHKEDNNVIVLAYPDSKVGEKIEQKVRHFLRLSCVRLSNGRSMVVLKMTNACVLKVYAACALCHTVLTTQWIDHVSADPTVCYIVPGPLCSATSTMTDKDNDVLGNICSFRAGDDISLKITARDEYGNIHNSGGSISSAEIRPVANTCHPDQQYPLSHRNLVQSPTNIVCHVQDNSDGTYMIKARVTIQGMYNLYINNKVFSSVKVNHGAPCPANFQLLQSNTYELSVSERVQCMIAMYDQYFNPCPFKEWQQSIKGKAVMRSSYANCTPLPQRESQPENVFCFNVFATEKGSLQFTIFFRDEQLPFGPIEYTVLKVLESLRSRVCKLQLYLTQLYGSNKTPTFTIHRDNLLESSMSVFVVHPDYFHKHLRVRFGAEPGIDTGGVSREFFHLLSQQLVDPQYALFQNINGFYKPCQLSSIDPNHLTFFQFFGKILGRAICDGHQIPVRFTPSVYKSLLKQKCSLDDLKLEDPTLHTSLLTILNSESEDALQELAVTFTAQRSHFGSLHTEALEEGGEDKDVTMENRVEFVDKLCNWHLQKCINGQLTAMRDGLHHVIIHQQLVTFSAHELEVILSGQPEVDIDFIRSRTTYSGYSPDHNVVQWLWDVLERFSRVYSLRTIVRSTDLEIQVYNEPPRDQSDCTICDIHVLNVLISASKEEQRCKFLQFTTGCSCLPSADMGQWSFRVQRGFTDPSSLPQAATCFNSISLPVYESKKGLKDKLELAIVYGQQTFLLH